MSISTPIALADHLEQSGETAQAGPVAMDELVRSFPMILDRLRTSYEELEARASHVEEELCRSNEKLENKVDELDRLKRHLEAVLESLPCGVVVRDASGVLVDVNAAAQSILGADVTELRKHGHDALRGKISDGEPHEVIAKDGRRLVVASHFSPVRDSNGELGGSVEILDDQTDRVEMIERLHAADKMAALGTMAGGIAHEIRNPLNAIKGFASLLLRRTDQDESSRRWSRVIVDAASEADTIIENMLSFGSPERLRDDVIDGEHLLEGAWRLARPDGDRTIDIRFHTDVPTFRGDQIKLRQSVRNLIANAIDAQPAHTTARVEVSLTREDETIVFRVGDAGSGVAPELRNRIFDPFYTNHPDGTGLGLALVSTIVRLHEGSVRVSPEPSNLGGATFVIRIPYRSASASAQIPHSQEG